jgi:hypothetical protein
MLVQAIKEALAASAAVTGLVADRIRPIAAGATDVRPYILFSRTAGEDTGTYQGPSLYKKSNVELAIVANTYLECETLSLAVRDVLDRKAFTGSTERFAPAVLEDETDVEQVIRPGAEVPEFLRTQIYRVTHRKV